MHFQLCPFITNLRKASMYKVVIFIFLIAMINLINTESCGGTNCSAVVSMPILDNLKASLKAEIDVSELNSHLTSYIQKEIQKGIQVELKDFILKSIDDKTEEAKVEMEASLKRKLSGVTYIRWGRKGCPDKADLVYTGQVGGNHYSYKGGGVNYLCMPNDPENGNHQPYANDQIFGGEFEINDATRPSGWPNSLTDKEVPCAVCHRREKSSILMIPGRKTCYKDWMAEYNGYLMSDFLAYHKRDFACVDMNAEPLDNKTSDENGALFYPIRTRCGSLRCPPYTNEADVYCVVCTL